MHKELFMLMISSHFASTLACWSGDVEDNDLMNYKNKKLWNGWDYPSRAPKEWEAWKKEWAATNKGGQLTLEDLENGVRPAGHDDKDWPPQWKGLQPGFSGIRPPPWAYVPKQVGKPTGCYEPPIYGNCEKFETRYGFNPYENVCMPFLYSGCGGNSNNFVTEARCREECHSPAMGCDPDSNIPVE